jgi:hypothetical protein
LAAARCSNAGHLAFSQYCGKSENCHCDGNNDKHADREVDHTDFHSVILSCHSKKRDNVPSTSPHAWQKSARRE